MNVLAENLPVNTIRLNSKVLSIKFDPHASYPIVQLRDGTLLRAKVRSSIFIHLLIISFC